VEDASPAAKAGVRTGDVVLSIDGRAVRDARDLSRTVAFLDPGRTATLQVWRDGARKELSVTVGRQSAERAARPRRRSRLPGGHPRGHARPAACSPPRAGRRRGLGGARSPAAEKGFKAGDVIAEVAGRPVASPEEVRQAVEASRKDGRKAVLFRVESREGLALHRDPVPDGLSDGGPSLTWGGASPVRARSPAATLSAQHLVDGDRSERMRLPVAWWTALAIAAAVPTMPISPRPFTPIGLALVVVLGHEHDVDLVDVRRDRDVILGQIVVHEAAEGVIREGLLVQRHGDAPDHAAEHLAARRLRVQDPPRRPRGDDAGHPDLAELLVHPHLREDRRVGVGRVGLLVGLARARGLLRLDPVDARARMASSKVTERDGSAVTWMRPLAKVTWSRVASPRGLPATLPAWPEQGLAHRVARGLHGGARGRRGPGASLHGGMGQGRIRDAGGHVLHRQPERVRADLGQDRVGAGADVGRR
jgi:hypothetical protein